MNMRVRILINKIRKKKVYFIIPFVIIIFLTSAYCITRQPLYQLKTRIKVENSYGVEPTDNEILSSALNNLGQLDASNPAASISSLKKRIFIDKDIAPGLIEISVIGPESKEIAKIVNELSDAYVREINLRTDRDKKGVIQKKENELQAYKNNLKKKLDEAKNKLEDYEARMEGTKIIEDKKMTELSSLKARLAELELERSNLLRVYTSVHPDVMKVDSEIAVVAERISVFPSEPTGKIQLERELEESHKIYNTLKEKWDESNLKVIEDLKELNIGATILSYAEAAQYPADLMKKRIIFFAGAVIAFVVSFLILAVAILFDTSMISPSEVFAFTHIPVIGAIPYIKPQYLKAMKIKDKSSLILRYENNNEIIEPYKLLYSHIQSNIFEEKSEGRSIFITSSVKGEGKSITACNLALTIAKAGKGVLLVEANLSNPSVHSLFGITNKTPGLTDVLNKSVTINDTIRDVTDILLGGMGLGLALKFKGLDRLKIITAGSSVSDTTGLLQSPVMNSFINELKSRFDYLILDGPPSSNNTDSLILASKCQATFVVYSAGSTARSNLKVALQRLELAQGREARDLSRTVKGVILNKCI